MSLSIFNTTIKSETVTLNHIDGLAKDLKEVFEKYQLKSLEAIDKNSNISLKEGSFCINGFDITFGIDDSKR